ncbi:NAD(P)/FAD-dependent oxidoreductase [Streptococcus sp. 20-1249]|uniref:NAD(P)/FAD-dependent oxidoreductase n=1 Tax=Streptococcus hepaticus TaxID=3349163 RepID=UPI003747DED4
MKKDIVIIGGGIVGSTAAFYLSQKQEFLITLIDEGIGTATRAAAGIICPWLSQRRNQDWYKLTSESAAFYPLLMMDLEKAGFSESAYKQTGTLVFKNKDKLLQKLEKIALDRRENAPTIGQLSLFTGQTVQQLIPQLSTDQGAILASGGGRVDGNKLLEHLQTAFVKNGGLLLKGKANLIDTHTVSLREQVLKADQIILAAGAWLPNLLTPLGYSVDVRPQKGQLLEVETDFATEDWPGCMLHGEIDILPFENGKLVIGASHEDDIGYDLNLDTEIISHMKKTAAEFIPQIAELPISATRIGTRAYTSDYAPFYGNLSDQSHIWVASGLGSSGLTSGPFIGWQIAQEIQQLENEFDRQAYSPDKYIKKID